MAIKELQTRIALKYDSYANWTDETKEGLGAKLVLLPGELGICYIGDANQESNVVPTVLFKVGDGEKTFKELPWASAKAADVYSWAKASAVEFNKDAKTLTFVKGNVDGSNLVFTIDYMNEADVKAITDDLSSRITALETSVGTNGDIGKAVADHESRLDVIEGSGDGSVAKALADAKTYTNEREAAIETAYKAYADQAEADAKKDAADNLAEAVEALEAADSALSTRIAAFEGDNGLVKTGDAATLSAAKAYAKEYADGLAGNYDAAGSAATAESNANTYTDGKVEAAVSAQATTDAAQNTEIGKKLDKDTYNDYIADKSMSDEALKEYAAGVADAAEAAAIAAAKTETQNQVKALADGQVEANRAAIAAMDTAYKKAVSDEAKAREDADKALSDRIDSIDTFFATAEGESLDTALDTLKEIQDYLNGEGTATNGMLGRLTQAEQDIDDLEAEFAADGRVTVAEKDIDDLQAAVATKLATETFNTWKGTHETDHAKSATEITAEIGAAVKVEKDRAELAEKAINDKIGTLPSDYTTLVAGIKAAKDQADQGVSDAAAVAGRMTTAETNITNLQTLTAGFDGTTIKAAVEAAANAADAADDKAVAAQNDVDALELVVNNETTGLAATKAIADKNKVDLAALTTRVGTAEGEIDTLQGIVDSGNGKTIRDDVTALQTLTGENGALRTLIAEAKKAGTDAAAAVDTLSKGQVATNKTNIEDHETRIAAIEGDYLTAADVYVFNCGSSTTVTHEQPKA